MRGIGPNSVLPGNGFHISYNDVDVDIYGGVTTAIIVGQGEAFHILNGDHRQQFALRIPAGLDACLDYFGAHPELRNARSDPLPDVRE